MTGASDVAFSGLDRADHSALHYGENIYGPGGYWNATIMGRLMARENALGRRLTPLEILTVGARLRRDVGLQDVKVLPYRSPP